MTLEEFRELVKIVDSFESSKLFYEYHDSEMMYFAYTLDYFGEKNQKLRESLIKLIDSYTNISKSNTVKKQEKRKKENIKKISEKLEKIIKKELTSGSKNSEYDENNDKEQSLLETTAFIDLENFRNYENNYEGVPILNKNIEHLLILDQIYDTIKIKDKNFIQTILKEYHSLFYKKQENFLYFGKDLFKAGNVLEKLNKSVESLEYLYDKYNIKEPFVNEDNLNRQKEGIKRLKNKTLI